MNKATAYHGTRHDADTALTFSGPIFFAADPDLAESYGHTLIEAEIVWDNALELWCNYASYNEVEWNGAVGTEDIAARAFGSGHDCVIFREIGDAGPDGSYNCVRSAAPVYAIASASQVHSHFECA